MDTPDGLTLGPDVDGRPTWYGLNKNVPDGWECRTNACKPWDTTAGPWIEDIVQARPVRLPDPEWLVIPIQGGGLTKTVWSDGEGTVGLTTLGKMRGRVDLDQWDYADNEPLACTWTPMDRSNWDHDPDDFPIIVRRVTP